MNRLTVLSVMFMAIAFISSCDGGGIYGSGHGGGDPDPMDIDLDSIQAYKQLNLPEQLIAQKPRALSSYVAVDDSGDSQNPLPGFSADLDSIASTMVDIQASVLLIDSVWPQLLAFCAGNGVESACTIPAGVISGNFSQSMAALEYQLRKLDSDESSANQTDSLADLERSIVQRIGTDFTLPRLQLELADNDDIQYVSWFDSALATRVDINWSPSGQRVSTRYQQVGNDSAIDRSVSHSSEAGSHSQINLSSQHTAQTHSTSISMRKRADDNHYTVSAVALTMTDQVTDEYHLVARSTDTELYAYNEVLDPLSNNATELVYRVYLDRLNDAHSVQFCVDTRLLGLCLDQPSWTLLSGGDIPTDSVVVFADDTVDDIAADSSNLAIELSGTPNDNSDYVILPAGTITRSESGQLFIQDDEQLLPLCWLNQDGSCTLSDPNYHQQLLCRVRHWVNGSRNNYRSYCMADQSDLLNAMVIGEQRVDGQTLIRLLPEVQVLVQP